MLVRIDLTATVQRRAGVGRYAEQLALALQSGDSSISISAFYTDAQKRRPSSCLSGLPGRAIAWSNVRWRMAALASAISGVPMDSVVGPADLFHATDHVLPHLRVPAVFTLHDVSYLVRPETHTRTNRWFLRFAVPRFLRQAQAIICPSHYTRAEASRLYDLDESLVHVIPEGVDEKFHPIEDQAVLRGARARLGLPGSYIAFVGTVEPRKNLVTLLDALQVLWREGREEKLVIVGRQGWLQGPVYQRVRELGWTDKVVFTGYVDDGDLAPILCGASVFVFPSLYEGFGLPPLEAMACGTPVVCSNTSSLPEVCGDAALMVSPTDVGEMAAAIRRALDDETLRATLSARGLARARQFTWEQAAQSTANVYHAVLTGEAQRRGGTASARS